MTGRAERLGFLARNLPSRVDRPDEPLNTDRDVRSWWARYRVVTPQRRLVGRMVIRVFHPAGHLDVIVLRGTAWYYRHAMEATWRKL